MRSALKNVDGIGPIEIKAGDPDFTVRYDSKKLRPEAIVKALVAGGETGAKVKT